MYVVMLMSCSNDSTKSSNEASVYITTGDKEFLLEKVDGAISEVTSESESLIIKINPSTAFQQVDGFGYTLTGGSAMHLSAMSEASRSKLLNELFGVGQQSIGINYLRISIGASDLDEVIYSYNDLPEGISDEKLEHFSIEPDRKYLIPVLKEILAINPDIKILGSPWSPPVWMKTFEIPTEKNRDPNLPLTVGGGLDPKFEASYANYFVKYIEAMDAEGIDIDAITIQNEPHHHRNNPSLYMEATQMRDFVKNHLGPAFEQSGIQTKIIIWDHNADKPEYPISILDDPEARKFIDGSAFHLYAGSINVLSDVRKAHPDKNLYFTEQYVNSNGEFGGDLMWHTENLIIGASRNWSKTVLQWNLTSNPELTPFTAFGGCNVCLGAITVNGDEVIKNQGYYAIGHASKFVPTGSVRIGSSEFQELPNVAFKTPSNDIVLIVLNKSANKLSFNIEVDNQVILVSMPEKSVATIVL